MSRPDHLDLTARHDWSPAAMPGANAPLDAVPLGSATAPFSMLGRFPQGFERREPGGYLATEEFVVLTGSLWLDGRRVEAGTLVHLGSGRLREELRASEACEVLVWFDGPPDFVPAADLEADPSAALVVADLGAGDLPLRTPVATWSRGVAEDWPARADGFSARGWAAAGAAWRWSDQEVVTWRTVPDVPPGEPAFAHPAPVDGDSA